jgi:hypothetical protein
MQRFRRLLEALARQLLISHILVHWPGLKSHSPRTPFLGKRPAEAVSTECQLVKMMAFVDTTIVSTKVVSRGHFRTSEG